MTAAGKGIKFVTTKSGLQYNDIVVGTGEEAKSGMQVVMHYTGWRSDNGAKGKKFDKKLIEYLTKAKTAEILKMDREFIAEAGECGLKSIMILLGILNNINFLPQLLSYETPFGVGYLVMNFKL